MAFNKNFKLSELKESLQDAEEFIIESKKLSLNTNEMLSEFLNAYIFLTEQQIGDDNHCISWYINQNNFGKNGLKWLINGVEYPATNASELYEIIRLENSGK